MKKLFSRLLPAVLGMMILSATTVFAQVNADAKAVYEDMAAKSNTISDGNMYLRVNMILEDGFETMNMAMDMNILFNNMTQPDKMQFLSQNLLSIDGQQQSFIMWYKDGYTYIEADGQKLKSKSDIESELLNALGLSNTIGATYDVFSDLTLTTEGDVRVLNYKMDDAKINAYMSQLFEEIGVGIEIRDIKGSYILTPDNYCNAATISMGMELTVWDETVSIFTTIDINILNQGQPVQFTLPDPAGYTEY